MKALLSHYLCNVERKTVFWHVGNYRLTGSSDSVAIWMSCTDRNLFAVSDLQNNVICTTSYADVFTGLEIK